MRRRLRDDLSQSMSQRERERGFYRFPLGKNGHVVAPEAGACSVLASPVLAWLLNFVELD